MKDRSNRDELLEEMLNDVASPDFRQTLLASTVRAANHRKVRRRVGALACLFVPLLLLLQLQQGEEASPRAVLNTSDRTPVIQPAEPDRTSLNPTIISDDELFAMFPDYALALVGRPGEQ